MVNINALLFTTNVIGMPEQQVQLNVRSLINFQDIVNNLVKKENDRKFSNIVNQINSNPEIMKSVYEVLTLLRLYGQINEVVSLNANELKNNQIINYVLNNNNLTTEEKQIVINSIKIISEQIIKNAPVIAPDNTGNYKNTDQQVNLFSSLENTLSGNISENSDSVNFTAYSAVTKNNTTAGSIQNSNIQTIQGLPPPDNPAKTASIGFVSPAIETKQEINSSTIISQSQKIDIAGNDLKINIPLTDIRLENLISIKNNISDLLKLISGLKISKNDELQQEIISLNNYIKELDNQINNLNNITVQDGEQIKNISFEVSGILNLIFISLINTTANLYNYQIYNNEDGQNTDKVAPVVQFIKNNNLTGADVLKNNMNIYKEENENNNLLKELISKIFLMLKKMNGELYIGKKIEYVYKPSSSQSSQVTPDGVLLINTAGTKNFREFFDLILHQLIDNKIPVKINNNSGILNISHENPAIINNKTGFNTIKEMIANPVSVNYPYDIPKTYNIAKDNINQSLLNTLNRNYNSNLKNIADDVHTYFINFIENKSEQRPVDTKIFEKIIDFSGKIRDDIVIKQIVKNITEAVKFKVSEKTEVKIMLRPENLGPVIVKFEAKDNVINGRIDVATTVVRDILKANIIDLKNSLNNLGYNVENFDISMLNAYTSGNSQSNLNYFNKQQQIPVYINNEIIEDIGVIAGTDSYLNYLA